jgi:hypothetical protein
LRKTVKITIQAIINFIERCEQMRTRQESNEFNSINQKTSNKNEEERKEQTVLKSTRKKKRKTDKIIGTAHSSQ